MAKMTIAQLREREVYRLAEYKNADPTEQDLDEARTLQNSYYRLCALSERLCYRQNSERLYNTYYTHELEAKEERWIKRINGKLKAYGLQLKYPGMIPIIYTEDGRHAIGTYFYE